MAELDGGNDEFAGGKVIIDNTAQEDEFSGGNVVVDNTSSKKKAVIIEPVNEFSKDILPNSPVSASAAPSTSEAEASKRIKGDLDADLNTKVMQIDGSKVTVQSLLDKGWTKEKISKNYNIPIIGGGEPKKREVSPSLIETTKKQFSTNPLFDIKNPNHEKNKEAYINNLADSGYDVTSLMQVAADVTKGKKLIEENTPISEKVPEYLKGLKGITPQANRETEYNKGTGYLLINDPDKAIKAFEKSVELNKAPVISQQQIMQGDNIKTQHKAAENPANAYYGIGLAYLDKKDDTQAQNAFIQGMEKDPANPENKLGLASIFEKQGNKQEAQKLVSQAADNYAQEATALQIQADQEADEKKNQRARDLMSMADKLQAYASGDPNHELGTLGMLTPQGFVMGMAQGVTHGLGTIKTGVENYIKGDKVKGGLGMLTGGAQTVFAAQPFVQTFNTFISPIKDLEQKYPDNQPLSVVSKLIDYPFALTTSIGRDFFDYKAEEGSKVALTMELADIVIMMGGGAIVHAKVNDAKSYANYVKDVAERAKNGEDVSKDIEQLKKFNETVAKINKGEIKIAAKKLGAKEVVKAIEKSEPIPSEEVKKLQDELDELSAAEVNDISAPIIEAKKKEIQEAIEKQKEKEHQEAIKDAVKKTEEQELEEKIKGLEQSIKDNKGNEDVVKVLQAELDKLKPKEENAGVKQPDEVVSETRETEDAPVTPKENDTVELPPFDVGYPNRKMVFKDGEWQASAGGKETSKVSDAVQKAAQEAFEKGNKPDTINAKEQVEGHKQNDGSTFMSGKDMGGTPNEAVSIFPERTKINKGNNVSEQDIIDFKEKNKDLLEGNEDVLGVGTWYDKKTDQTYIDVTSIIPKEHAKEAHELGRDYNQKETVSLEDFKSTDTGGDGTIKEGWKKEKDRIAEIRQAQKGEYIKSKEQPKAEAPKKEKPHSKKDAQLKLIEDKRKADAEKAKKELKTYTPETIKDLDTSNETGVKKKVLDFVKRNLAGISPIIEAGTGNKASVVIHTKNSTFEQAVTDAGGSKLDAQTGRAFYFSKDGSIHLNMEKVTPDTGAHELFHPLLDYIEASNPKAIDALYKQLRGIEGGQEFTIKAAEDYTGATTIKKEAITDFIAKVAIGDIKITPTNIDAIKNFINKVLETVGLKGFAVDMGLDLSNAKDLKELATLVSEKFSKGEEIKPEEFGEGGRIVSNKPQLQAWGGFIKNGYEEQKEWKELEKSGHIRKDFKISSIAGKKVLIINPDNMLTGGITTADGTPIINGNGGINFVSKWGDVWASSDISIANTLARKINEAREADIKDGGDGIAHILVSKGDLKKSLSSHTGAKASMAVLEHLADKKLISLSEFRNALNAVGKKYKINFDGRADLETIHKDIQDKFFGVENSSFLERGYFVQDVITHLSNNSKTVHENIEPIRGLLNSSELGRKIKFAGKGVSDAIGLLLSDNMTVGVKNSNVYATIEVNKPVVVEKGGHESYPFHIKQSDGSRPILNIVETPEHVTDIVNNESNIPVPKNVPDKNGRNMDGSVKLGSNTVGYATGIVKPKTELQFQKDKKKDLIKGTYYEHNTTVDENGNRVFFHVSDAGKAALEKGIDSRKQNSTRTSREEKGLQYGVASFYTKPSDGEGMVGGEKYQVTVAPEKVYPMDTDPNGYKEKAEQKVKEGTPFRRENIKKQMAEMARKDGYEMAVAEWNYDRSGKGDGKLALRADALVPLKAEDLKETSPATDKQIPHPDQQEILNQEKINDLAQDIYDYKSKKEEYDDAYSIAQDIITYGEKPSAEDFKTMTDGAPKKLQEKIKEAKSAAQFSKGNRNKNVDDYHDDYVKVAKLGLEEDPNYTIDDLAQDTGFKKEDLQGVWDEATGNEAPKETTGGGKKKTLVTKRVYEGDFKEEVKKKLEEIGLYRKEIPFEEAEKTAKKAIDEVGIDAALDAVRDGDIIGGAAAEVYAAKLLDIDKKMLKETDPIEFDKLAGEFAEITDEAGREQTSAGQYNAQWAKIYKETDLGFNVEKKIKEFKDQNNGVIPPEIEAKFRENDRQIKELTAKISELEAEAEKTKAEAAVKEIQESLDREKKNKVTEQRASDKIRKQTDKLVAKVERAKFHRPTTFNMASPASLAWDSAVNVVEATIVITGRTAEGVARAVEAGLDHIKETDWYKNLEEKKQKEAEKAYREFFDAEEKTNGKIKIPHSLIREKVEGGADTIEKLTKEIQDAIKEEYPDATEREVRDAITKYGEVVNPNKEQIEVEIRKIKRLGKLLSQLEDIQNKKRPLKSGQQRDKMDAEERAKMKEVREAMKDLPIDATLEAEQLKTATDAAKQRIRNQIEDLQREIDKGEQVPKNSRSIQEDAELKDLKDKRDKIKAEHEALFKDEEANRLEQAIKAAEKSILEYERRIKEGELYPDKKQSAIETPELKALRDKRDVLKDEIERLKKIKPIAGASTGWDNKTGKFYVEINGKRIKEFDTRKEAENFAFGRTPEQVATEAAIKAAERQADELERRIQAGELEVAKKQSLVQNTSELQSARERLSKQREELRKLQEDAGIIERKRLEQTKKNAERRIAELQRRINEGDFSKKERKPLIADTELTRLRAEKIRLQEEYEKELYKNKLANRTTTQIVKDALWDIWGLTRVLSATGEMSFVGIQGLTQSVAHPKIAGEAFKTALRFMFSEKKTEQWLDNLKAQDFYPELKQSKLAITQPYAEITAREELFYSDHVNMVWNFLGLPLKYKSAEAYKTWQAASPLKAFERAAVGYLDTLRVMRYLDGRQLLQDKGITFENNPEAYKDMADVLNTLTGRASLGFAEQVAPQLTKVFFSPRNWASAIKTATPYGFIWLGKKRAGADGWKPSVAQKMALSDLSKVIGATAGIVALAALKYNNDDDDETSVELDPRSSDFGKIKLGNTRVDPWGGRVQQVVFMSRLIADAMHYAAPDKFAGGFKNAKGEVVPLGTPYKAPSSEAIMINMAINKLSPSASLVENFLSKVPAEGGGYTDERGNPYSFKEDLKEKIHPIYWSTVAEMLKDDPTAMDGFLLAYAFFGGGVSVYETKPKTEVLSSENEDVNKVLKSAQIKTYSDKSGFNQAGEEVKLNETQVKSINDLRNSYIERKLSSEVARMKKMSDHDIDNRVDKIKSDATKYAKYKVVGYLLSDTKKNLREAAEAMLTPREKELPTTKRNARIEWYIKQFDKDQEKELERLEREFR